MTEAQRKYYLENREHILAQKKAYRLANLEMLKAKDREYHEANREERIARSREYARTHRQEQAVRRREYVKANPEIIRTQKAESYKRTRAKARATQKAYHEKNRDKLLAKARVWNAAHPNYSSEYDKRNPDAMVARVSRRRARKKGNGGSVTKADLQAQLVRQKGKCYYCEVKLGKVKHHDHIWPISKGGSSHPCNIVISCARCNLRKSRNEPHVVGLLL